ncbi:SidA/IucD/PvdA family monooxygenase [Streptomyces nogalater]
MRPDVPGTRPGPRHRPDPYVPARFRPHLGDRVCHSSEYLWRLEKRRAAKDGPLDVAVVGASQSAAEIALDLHSADSGDRIHAIMRGFGYRLKDTSPFSEEAYLPEFTDYYFNASREAKAALDAQLRPSNYSSVDQDVLESLYVRRYEDGVDGEERILLHRNSEVTGVRTGDGPVRLTLRERHTGEAKELTADLVVLATGYRDLGPAEHDEPYPRILGPVADGLALDDTGVLRVERDYFVPPRPEAGRGRRCSSTACARTPTGSATPAPSVCCRCAPARCWRIRHRLGAGPAPRGARD